MSEWWGVALYTVQSEEARPHHSRIVQDKKYQYSQRLSFTGTQGKFRLFSTSLTSKRKTHMKLAWCHMPLNPIIERQRLAEYWLQGQPRLQRVWQQPGPHGENSSQRNWQKERNHVCLLWWGDNESQLLGGKINRKQVPDSAPGVYQTTSVFHRKWMSRLEGTGIECSFFFSSQNSCRLKNTKLKRILFSKFSLFLSLF